MNPSIRFITVTAAIIVAASSNCPGADDQPAQTLQGLTGQISDLKTAVPAPDKAPPLDSEWLPADINLKRMAEWAMRYLIRVPRKELNYEPVFQCFPSACPPIPEGHDVVVPCDSDARLDWEWYYMRDISGSKKGMDVEQAYHQRMRGYVDEEGIVWAPPGAYNEGNINARYEKKDYVIHIWGATKILKSLAEDYDRTQSPGSKAMARKIMLGLKGLMKWDDRGRCYSPCGQGALDAKRNPVPNGWNPQPAPLVESLATYYLVFQDNEALSFAKAYADGIIDGLQPDGVRFGPDGSFQAHSHCTMHAVWGVAHLGEVTGDRKYIDFAKRVWDWFSKRGTGGGWFPAAPDYPGDETCCVADMMSTAACIARSGYPEYFDYVERFLRNRISPAQFILTPEFVAKYSEQYKDAGEQKLKKALESLDKIQGGFLAGDGLIEWENNFLGAHYAGQQLVMIGCCIPEGMRSTYTAWDNTIAQRSETSLGPAGVYVSLCFTRDSKWGKVVSFMPEQGRLSVKAAVKETFFLRPPHWAPREPVRAFVNSRPVPVQWSGAYVQLAAKPGDEITITYPLISFTHHIEGIWKAVPNLRVTYTWLGNMITGVTPPAKGTPVFIGRPRVLPPAP